MRPERLHFSEVTTSELDRDVTATRYFPVKEVSQATQGVKHLTFLCEQLTKLGWIETARRQPYMYQGRKTSTFEYERSRSQLILTIYSEHQTNWAFVKIRGLGSDVVELRDWMTSYETDYGRMPYV